VAPDSSLTNACKVLDTAYIPVNTSVSPRDQVQLTSEPARA
jgi:hypothetical protein